MMQQKRQNMSKKHILVCLILSVGDCNEAYLHSRQKDDAQLLPLFLFAPVF